MRRVVTFFGRLVLISLVMGVAGGYYVANRYFNDDALAKQLTKNFNRTHRGRIEIGSIHWRSKAILQLLRNGYDEVIITDLRIYDSRGHLALHVPRAVGSIKLWDIILRGDFFLEHLTSDQATIRLERYLRPDGANREGDLYEIGLVGAFETTKKAARKDQADRKKQESSGRSSHMVVRRFNLKGITLITDFGDVGLRLDDVSLAGRLQYASAVKSKPARLYYDLRPAARGGTLRYNEKLFDISRLEVQRLSANREHPDRVTVDATMGLGQATLTVRGGLLGLGQNSGSDKTTPTVPTVALKATATRFGGLLAKLSGRQVVDHSSRLEASLHGPITDPAGVLRVSGLGLRHGKIEAKGLQLAARYESGVLLVDQLVTKLLGGTLNGRARLELGSGQWWATVGAKGLDTSGGLAAPQRERLGGTLHGWLDAAGQLDDPTRGWTRFDVSLLRHATRGPLPRRLRVEGDLHASMDRLDIRRLSFSSPVLSARAKGRFWPQKLTMDLALNAEAKRLRGVLLKMGMSPLLAALSVAGRAKGGVYNPRFVGTARVYGVRSDPVRLRQITANVGLANGTFSAKDVKTNLYGGTVSAWAQLALYNRDVRKMYRNQHLKAGGQFAGLSTAGPTGGSLRALFGGRFNVNGPLGFLRGGLTARSSSLWAANQRYRNAQLGVRFRPGQVTIDKALLFRNPKQYLSVKGKISTRGRIALKVTLRRLPLSLVPALAGPEPPVSGVVDTEELTVSGTTAAPVLEGTVRLLHAAIRGVDAGSGAIRLTPNDAGDRTQVSGSVLSFLSFVGARSRLSLRTPPSAELRFDFHDVPLETYLPELARAGDIQGTVSGTLAVTVGSPGGVQKARLVIRKLHATLTKPPGVFDDQAPQPAVIKNWGDIVLTYDGERLTVRRFILTGRGELHRLALYGDVGPRSMNLQVRGRMDLLPLEMLAGEKLPRLRGNVGVNVFIKGSPQNPQVRGALYPASITLRTPSLEDDLVVRGGAIMVSNKGLDLRGLRIILADDEAELNGLVQLKDWRPGKLALTLLGELSPKGLGILATEWVQRPRGQSSRIDLKVGGTVDDPNITGVLALGRMQMGLRGHGKELAIRSGRVDFTKGNVRLSNVRGTVDDGPFELNGDVALRGFDMNGLDLRFVGEAIPHRSGGSYEMELNLNVRITGRGDYLKCRARKGGLPAIRRKRGWADRFSGSQRGRKAQTLHVAGDSKQCYTLSGTADVVDGRYIRKFSINPVQRILSPSRVDESAASSGEENEFLRNLKLNLTVTMGSLRVKNNLADIGLEGDLTVSGFYTDYRIGGTVLFKEGSFTIPFLRGRYSNLAGSVNFDRGRPEGIDEPYVSLQGSSTYTDRSETEHEIKLSVTGYLSRLVPNWSTNTGLTSSQTLVLLATGRTPDQLRKGRSASIPNLAPLIADYLPVDLQLDLSSDSVQVFVEKRLGRFFKLRGEVEMGYSGSQRQEGKLIFRVTDGLSTQVRAKRREQGQDVTVEDDTLSGRVEVRYKIRLRTSLRRSLGL
jgi:TamB, inner membrane protein subunit of TAM complex